MNPSSSAPRVLLAHSFYLRYDDKQYQRMKPYPPLATLLAAAALRQRGFDIRLFDAMLSAGVEEFCAALDEAGPAIVAIVEDNFNFITKMCTMRMREAAFDMVRAAKARGCRVAVNGSDAVDHPEHYIGAGADAVITGEVEPTLSELVESWAADRDAALDKIAGLALGTHAGAPSNGDGAGEPVKLRRTAPRAYLGDLDSLPFPAWDLVDVERYRDAWTRAHGRLSWNLVTSRGCPYGCNWCAKPIWGRRYAQRSPALVAEELCRLRDSVAPDHIWFADDIFGLTPAWIEAFADEVVARDAQVPFMMQSRVNLMRPRTVAALRAAGAEEVWLGVESGSQGILDAMGKGTRLEQVPAATRTLKEHGIRACWFVMLGYPGEDWGDILRTRDLIRDQRPDDIGVSVAYPLPGTEFYERVRAQLGAKRNWEDTDDLAMMFRGTYQTAFYKRVRDLLHDEVRAAASDSPRRRPLDEVWLDLESREDAFRLMDTAAIAAD